MGRQRMFATIGTRVCLTLLMFLTNPTQGILSKSYLLSTSEIHYILSGDIEVQYKIPVTAPALRVQLIELSTGSKGRALAKMDIPPNTTSGIVIFRCGLLVQAEKTAFRLITIQGESVMVQTKPIDVRWPAITVHVPLLVETYSSDVIVQVHLGSINCKPRKERTYSTYVDLVYEGTTLTPSGEGKSVWHEPAIILSKRLDDWLLETSYDVTMNCEYFDRAGYYKVRIRTSSDTTPIIAESGTIHVIWSHRYSVSVTRTSVEPCDDNLKIIYHYPRCASDRDRLRVYGKMWRDIAKPPKYIFESRVHTGRHFTKLSCDLFGEELQEYCFSFVSTAKNGAVYELDTQCIPRLADTEGLHPIWREWGPWSDCSATCGQGVHSRYRLCSSTKSTINCEGKSVQTELCNIHECPEPSSTTSHSYTLMPTECLCGCSMNLTTRTNMKVDFVGCELPTYWILQASPTGRITVTVLELFFPSIDDMLVIRDGSSSLGTVLAMFSHSDRFEVHSISPILRLEVHSTNTTPFFDGATLHLMLTLSDIPQESMAIVQTVLSTTEYSLSTVHITMILLTVILCTAAIFLTTVLYLRNAKILRESAGSPSLCSLSRAEHERGSPVRHLLTASTSTSELSDSSLMNQQNKRRMSTPSKSPEDYLHNSFLFRSISSVSGTNPSPTNTPTPRRMHFSSKVEMQESITMSKTKSVEEKSPIEFDASKKPLKSVLKKRIPLQNPSCSDTPSPVRRRGKPPGRAARQVQRDSTTPLTASVSELSITGSEDGFEYDYYDYGCHDEPGSYFCPDPILVGWPPFIPVPPDGGEETPDLPLQHFTSTPTQVEQDAQSIKSTKS